MSAAASNLGPLVIGGGFATAFAFGVVASRSNFCTMGALSDAVTLGHWGRMRMWLLAMAVAILGATWLSTTGMVDLAKAVARRPVVPWLSHLVGGLLFGIGMTLAGGCANKNLLRLGGGSIRSLVVLVFMAIASYMTLKGLFAEARSRWLDPVALNLGEHGLADSGLGSLLAQASGLAPATAAWLAAAAVALPMLAWVFKDARFRANTVQVFSGLALGALVVVAWYWSGHLGFGEHPETMENVYFATNSRTLESLSFVAPLAYTLELLMLWTDRSLHLSFGIACVAGVVAGSAVHALASGKFRWEGFASRGDLRNQLIGAGLMGFGGVTAMGCTVGQGLTGVSTLAIGAFLTVLAIAAGSVATLKLLLRTSE